MTAFVSSPSAVSDDPPLAVGVGDRVLQHMLDRLAQPPRIAEHMAGGRRDLRFELLRFFRGARAARLNGRAAQACDVDSLLLERNSARVAGRQVEHVVDQLGQPLDGFEDRADIILRPSTLSSPA